MGHKTCRSVMSDLTDPLRKSNKSVLNDEFLGQVYLSKDYELSVTEWPAGKREHCKDESCLVVCLAPNGSALDLS